MFANTFTQTDSESFSSSVIGICEMSLWTSNMTPPPWIFLSFLYILYGQVSGKSSEVAIELSILVSWIATTLVDESQGKPAIPVFCLLCD